MNAHIQIRKLKYIIFFFLLFSFSKSDFKEINLEKNDFSETYSNQMETLKFKIKGNSSPYIKITAKGKNPSIKNHIISYYQDEDLKKRKQLSQSIKDTTIMWLTKDQIKKDFYITIECSAESFSLEININKKEKAELYLNEQYTYFVSKENKEMDFILKNSQIEYDENEEYYVALWVRGNYEIETKISGGNTENHSSSQYSYYRIEFDDDFTNSKITFKIKGEVGDLINVGLIFFWDYVDNYCSAHLKLENGEEVSGYLPLGVGHYFPYNILDDISQDPLGNYYDFNNKHMSLPLLHITESYYNEKSYFVESQKKDIFYTIQHIYNTVYDGQGNNKYSPLLNGVYNYQKIYEDTTIGLIPMKPEDDFNFLTYEIIPVMGNISVSIYECDNYPLCNINIGIKESKKIDNFREYYYTTYSNKEWGDITPISKKQKMLLITCINGIKNKYIDNLCAVNINMKTNKKMVNFTDYTLMEPPYQRFISKNNEDKYFIERSNNPIHLYIEKITGNFIIEINGKENNYKKYSEGNKYFFLIPKNTDVNIKIKAKDNSFYSLNANFNNKKEYFSIGYNYLLSLENDIELKTGTYDEDDEEFNNETLYQNENNYKNIILNGNSNDGAYDDDEDNALDYFIGIYPLNCEINVQVLLDDKSYDEKTIEKDNFYQNILSELKEYKFKIKNVNSKSSGNCMLYITSYFKYFCNYYNYITLSNGISQTINFNKNNNLMKFSFPHTNLEKDIKLNFTLLNEGEYKAKINISGENSEKDINESKEILLKADYIKSKCQDFKSICYIFLDIETKDSKKESNLKITLTTGDNKDDDDDDDEDDDKKLIIILSIIGVVVVAIIIGFIIYILKTIKKNKDLNQKVNQISFKEENNDIDAVDTLLD